MAFQIVTQTLSGNTPGVVSFNSSLSNTPPLFYGIQNFKVAYNTPSDQTSFGVSLNITASTATSVTFQASYPPGTDLTQSSVDVAVLVATDGLPDDVLFANSSGSQAIMSATPIAAPIGSVYAAGAALTGFNVYMNSSYQIIGMGASCGVACLPSSTATLLPISTCTLIGNGAPNGSTESAILALSDNSSGLLIAQTTVSGISNTISNPFANVSNVACFLQSFYTQFPEPPPLTGYWCSSVQAGIPTVTNTATLGTSTVNILNDGGDDSASIVEATYLIVGLS